MITKNTNYMSKLVLSSYKELVKELNKALQKYKTAKTDEEKDKNNELPSKLLVIKEIEARVKLNKARVPDAVESIIEAADSNTGISRSIEEKEIMKNHFIHDYHLHKELYSLTIDQDSKGYPINNKKTLIYLKEKISKGKRLDGTTYKIKELVFVDEVLKILKEFEKLKK